MNIVAHFFNIHRIIFKGSSAGGRAHYNFGTAITYG